MKTLGPQRLVRRSAGCLQPPPPTNPESILGFSSGFYGFIAALGLLASLVLPASAHESPPGCSGSGLGIDLFANVGDVHIGDTLRYSVRVFNSPFPACDATAITAFVVTPDGVTNSITPVLVRNTLLPGQSDFYTNVVSYVVRAQDVNPDGTVRATATDKGDIHQNDTDSRGGGNQGVNTEVNLPCVSLAAQCVAGAGENGAITFTGAVTNCGNSTLVGITITNFVNGVAISVLSPTNLAIGQSVAFSGSWIPANACEPSTAIIMVNAKDEFTAIPRPVTKSVTITCQNTVAPGIKVTKSCPVAPVAPGQMLTFSGSVSNTGNITLTNIVVMNDRPAANTTVFTLATLAPGATAFFTGSYPAPADCSISDTLTATANSACGEQVSNSATASCPIATAPQVVVTESCPVTPVVPGSSPTFSGTVHNSGNITLKNVVVTSDRPAAGTVVFTAATMAPGESAAFTGTYTVPAGACSLVTTFNGTGTDICSLAAATTSVSTTCAVVTAPAIDVKLSCPAFAASTGGPMAYTGTVRNSGNVALVNVFVVNNHPSNNTPVIGPINLAVGASADFIADFIAPLDACSLGSTVIATGFDSCASTSVTNTASASCSLVTAPAIQVTQVCPVAQPTPGAILTYTGTVKNSGNITLTNVVVLNNLSGATPVFTVATLSPGATAAFSGSYVAATNCTAVSTSTATATSLCGIDVSNSATTSCGIQTAPAILVAVSCPVGPIVPGSSPGYGGTVKNNGNITLTNVVVISDRPSAGTVVFAVDELAPGASAAFTGAYLLPAGACTVVTAFSATGKDICTLAAVTNTIATSCLVTTAPALAVTLSCPASPASTGGLITLNGTLRNSGDVALLDVVVVNNNPSNNTPVLGPITLAAGASIDFPVTFTVPTNACSIGTTLTATGRDSCTSVLVTNIGGNACTLVTAPGIIVTQSCPVSPAALGGLVTFTGTVKNSGNINLKDVVVMNNLSGATPVFTVASLPIGATASFTGSFTAALSCAISSTSVATATSICGVSVTSAASSTCVVLTAPAIVVTQICPTTPVLQGGVLNYSGTVSNSGNITLTNVIVASSEPSPDTVVLLLASLAPGETAAFTGSYPVPTNCCVVSSTVRASGQGCDGATVKDSATKTCVVQTSPSLAVTKICAPGTLKPGDLLGYSGVVSNSGNITLVQVMLTNSQTPGAPVFGPVTLAPGESFSYNASYVVPEDFCGTDTVTATGLNVCTLLPVVSRVTVTCPVVTSAPGISVSKNCPLLPTPHGGIYTYTGVVKNTGKVTLVDVFVVDSQPTNTTPVMGPITLAPGESMSFSGSYLAPLDCCEIIDTVTAYGTDRCLGGRVSSTATAVCPLLTMPSVKLVQDCQATPILVGSVYSFSGFVTNTGDVVLTNLFVFGPQGTNSPLLGPIELAPGESEAYHGSYTVPMNTCAVTITVGAFETCHGSNVLDSASCPVATMASIGISQTCPSGPVQAGAKVDFSGVLTNTGNVTLAGVYVFNGQSAGGAPVLGPITLQVGASMPFNGSYIATSGSNPGTNTVVTTNANNTLTTNLVVSFTPTNTITATGRDTCQARSIAVAADCHGVVAVTAPFHLIGAPSLGNGVFRLTFPTDAGKSVTVQFKNKLSDLLWTDLETVAGSGGDKTITDPTASQNPSRFYRIISKQ